MADNFLVSFHPLCTTAHGRRALANHPHLVPFSDGACRREPELESRYASITALCRRGVFAPQLDKCDRVFYMSVKREFKNPRGRNMPAARALVAALRIIKRCETHEEAAEWYRERGQPLPSNCMVRGNPYLPRDYTTGLPAVDGGMRQDWYQSGRAPETMTQWNAHYAARVAAFPVFLIAEHIVKPRLQRPPILLDEDLAPIFDKNRVPNTQAFKRITDEEFSSLKALLVAAPN